MGQAASIMGSVGGGMLNVYAAYGSYKDAQKYGQRNTMFAQLNSRLQQQQFNIQAAFLAQQASAYMAQSGAFVKQSDAYLAQAQIAARTGQILQANEMTRASQAEKEADEQSRRAAELRRQMIGGAKTQFAANGVLLESRPQSAVAMWEQDETADLAFELQGIKEKRDNEVWGHVWNGNQARLQGLFDAQALKLQSDASMIEAGNARINASASMAQSRIANINATLASMSWLQVREQGNAAVSAARWNMYGAVGSMIGSTSASTYSYSGGSGGKSLVQTNNDASVRTSSPLQNA